MRDGTPDSASERDQIDPDFTRDILESDIPRDVLEILLADRTTGKNIMWMTDGYKHLESVFDMKMGVQDQIDIDVISRPGNKIIRPRVDKSKAEQKERIQKKAEVFTPSWICNNMINEFDAAWFDRKPAPFTTEGSRDGGWKRLPGKVEFPDTPEHTWLDYVKYRCLEMCCGEGGGNADEAADSASGDSEEQKKRDQRIKTLHSLIVFYSFLVPERVHSLDEILAVIDKSENNRRIARHLELEKDLLERYRSKVGWQTLQQLDYKIQNLDRLANETQDIDLGDEYKDTPKAVKKAIVAMRKFGRLGEAKIVTPPNIAYDMVRQIPGAELKALVESGRKILDLAAKMGEFAIAIVRRCAEPDIGLSSADLAQSILSIPMCGVTYEFTRKVYELLGLDVACIARPENMNTYDLLKIRKEDGKTLDYAIIKRLLTQNKDFETITIGDEVAEGEQTMCKTIGRVISNPPYQELDGGAQVSAIPIYPMYVGVGSEASERYSSFIMPARWYAGGKGLDEFRDDMLKDDHIAEFHDFPMTDDCFPGVNVRGGLCFYLRDCQHDGNVTATKYYSHLDSKHPTVSSRNLKVRDSDIVIRYDAGIAILDKIFPTDAVVSMVAHVSAAKAFGLRTFFISDERFHAEKAGLHHPVKCFGRGGAVGYVEKDDIPSHQDWIARWKVFIPEANNIGTELNDDNQNAMVGGPGTICTETYLVVGAELNLTRESSKNLANYLKTRFARFLVSLAKSSQHGTSKTFRFVPLQDFTASSDIDWSKPIPDIDRQLYAKYGLTEDEQKFIESMIKPME